MKKRLAEFLKDYIHGTMNKYVLYLVPFVTHCFVINMYSLSLPCIIKAAILNVFFLIRCYWGQDLTCNFKPVLKITTIGMLTVL